MKKLLILLLLSCPLWLSAQNPRIVRVATSNAVTTDKYYWIDVGRNHPWRFHIEWTGNDGTTSTIVPVTKISDTATVAQYPNITAHTITGATGSKDFRDTDGQCDQYLGLFVDVQAGKTVTFNIWLYFNL